MAYYYTVVNIIDVGKNAGRVVAVLALMTICVVGLSLMGSDWDNARMFPIPAIYDNIPNLISGLPGSGISMSGDLFNPRWVGITMGFLVPTSLAVALFGEGRELRVLCSLAALLGTGTLLLSQSIQGLLGLTAGIIFLVIWRSRWSLLVIAIGATLVTAGLMRIGPQSIIEYLLTIDNPIGIAVVLRLDIWSRALAMIENMPFTGIGLNTFPLILSDFFPGYLLGPEPHAHNLYLQTALDFGLIGLFALLWLVVAWCVAAYKNYQRADSRLYQVLLAGLAAGIISYLAHGFLDSLMLGAKPSVAIWVMLGLGAQSLPEIPAEQTRSALGQHVASVRLYKAIPLVILALVIILILVTTPTALTTNNGFIFAHQGLYQAHETGTPPRRALQVAQSYLIRSYEADPENVYVADTLGRIYAWEDDYRQATQTFIRRIKIDSVDPFHNYYPPTSLLRKLKGESMGAEDHWEDLIKVYRHWMNRYPDHAEHYVRMALVWELYNDDPERAASTLNSGLENNAQPSGIFRDYLQKLQQ
jgi:O-antigen ligase